MKPNDDLRILIVYDDLPAGVRAKALVGCLSSQLDRRIDLQTTVWKFACLDHPKLQQALSTDASDSDVIIVASDAELPVRVRDWLDQCLSEKGDDPTALVALPDLGAPEETAPLCAALRQMADRRQVSFFCPQPPQPGPDARREYAAVQPSPERIPITWEEAPCPETDCREWGIND